MRNIRIWATVVLLFVLVGPLFATGNAEESDAPAEPITLDVWSHYSEDVVFDTMIKPSFEAQYPNVTAAFETIPGGQGALFEKILVGSRANELPDVAVINSGNVPQLVHLNLIDPVEPEAFGVSTMEEWGELWDGGTSVMKWGDEFYGVAFSVSTYVMLINAEHFREAGLDPDTDYPLTWIEGERSVARIGQLLMRREEGRVVREAYGINLHPWAHLINFYNMYGALGAELFNPDGETATLDSPEAERVFRMLRDLAYEYEVSVPSGTGTSALKRDEFLNGTVSMIDTVWSWFIPSMRNDYPELWDDGDGVRFIPMPRFADGEPWANQAGSLWVTLSASEHKDEAWALQKVIMDNHAGYLGEGLFVPVKGYENSPQARDLPQFEMFREILRYPGSTQALNADVGEITGEVLTRVLFEDAEIQPLLEEANAKLERYLADLPYPSVPLDK